MAQEVDDALAFEHVGLADQHRRVGEAIGVGPQLLESDVHARPVVEHARRDADQLRRRVHVQLLADGVHDVDPEPVDAPVAPEAQHVGHRRSDLGVVPVQVGLFGQEQVQVVLTGVRIEGPCRVVAEGREPVGRRTASGGRVSPHVPVALGILTRRAGLGEPGVLIGAVPGHVVQHDLQSLFMARGDHSIRI